MTRTPTIVAAGVAIFIAGTAQSDWIDPQDETGARLLAEPDVGAADLDQKAYAWGDLDLDGDLDLVVARKQPWTSAGRRINILLMNEGVEEGHSIDGVLVDRTAEFASASDVPDDHGFLTPTNDRDVVIADVDGDGWLDVITAVSLTDNAPKHVSHPRVYHNLGEDDKGQWLGLIYEDARIPLMHLEAGPRFSAVAAGDVTGDGAPDLYFTDHDSGGNELFDFNDRLLINDGNGFFADVTAETIDPKASESAFGSSVSIVDINGDGVNDIVKTTSLSSPTSVTVIENDPSSPGAFGFFESVYENAPYYVSAGDLNGDGRLDLVITDVGVDRYMINTGNDPDGHAQFQTLTFPDNSGFGGDSRIADLDGDGRLDVVITDADIDIPGCTRETEIYRNLGGDPPVFAQESEVIPEALREGVHDAAVFDINGDGALDVILGRCVGTTIWMGQICLGDLNGDGRVNVNDLVAIILAWGTSDPAADLDDDGVVDADDLVTVIVQWGPC